MGSGILALILTLSLHCIFRIYLLPGISKVRFRPIAPT